MQSLNTNDPTTIGMLIVSALIIVGGLIVSRLLRPIERLIAKRNAKSAADKKANRRFQKPVQTGEQPRAGIAQRATAQSATLPKPGLYQSNDGTPDYEGQWDRIIDRIDDDLARIKQASNDQSHAITQLDAAEFSISELFREFPDARKQLNPVTYVEFPALKSRHASDAQEQVTDIAQAATA